MTNGRLHIICFDNPYPPAYGGAIDVYYRIRALSEEGVNIILHCFYKGNLTPSAQLEELCEHVYYYPRKTSFVQQLSLLPYGVTSREHPDLLPRLMQDEAPILFEGLVSCALMAHPSLRNRRKYFRECNVEHHYYHALGKATPSFVRKVFYHLEAERLRLFERKLLYAQGIFALAHQDEAYFKQHYPSVPTTYIPCFHGHEQVSTPREPTTPYILYHGNLSVAENHRVAAYIATHLADRLPYRIIIAGYHPSPALQHIIAQHPNMQLVSSPDQNTMEQLIQDAKVHLLLTFQSTGIKLKLLNVLYTGQHVVVNPEMVVGTELAELCHIGHSAEELVNLCSSLMQQSIEPNTIETRQSVLDSCYNNRQSAQQLRTFF
ncbi:MAG: glycosyltransferase family 1 protein [Paludibacteraceae bacterium]|nr:glycosyltransferase family 1 protein [Paludibacteraceae bacterium]